MLRRLRCVEACWDGLVVGVTKVLCCGPGNKEAAPVQRERGCEVWWDWPGLGEAGLVLRERGNDTRTGKYTGEKDLKTLHKLGYN